MMQRISHYLNLGIYEIRLLYCTKDFNLFDIQISWIRFHSFSISANYYFRIFIQVQVYAIDDVGASFWNIFCCQAKSKRHPLNRHQNKWSTNRFQWRNLLRLMGSSKVRTSQPTSKWSTNKFQESFFYPSVSEKKKIDEMCIDKLT